MNCSRLPVTWDSDHGIINFLSKECFRSFLHLSQNHGTDFLRAEHLGLTILNFHLYVRFSILVDNLIRNKDGKPYIQVKIKDGETKVFSPEEISAMVLIKMKETAEAFLGKKINDAVVTVPGNWKSETICALFLPFNLIVFLLLLLLFQFLTFLFQMHSLLQ